MADAQVTQRVRSMSNGISTQAPTVRFPSQVEDATNVNFSILDGAVKRHGSDAMFRLDGAAVGQNYAMHLIERDEKEQFLIVYGKGGYMKVVDLVNPTNAVTIVSSGTFSGYLSSNSPEVSEVRFMTVGDTTFVLNRTVATELSDPDTTGGTQYGFKPESMPHRLVVTGVSESNNVVFTGSPIPWTDRNFYEQVIKRPSVSPPTQGTFTLRSKGEHTEAYLNPGDTGYISDNTLYHIPWDAEASNFVEGAEGDGIDQYLEVVSNIGNGKTVCIHGPLKTDDVIVEFSRDLKLGDGSPDFPGGTSGHLLSVHNIDLNNNPYYVERGSDERNPPPDMIKKNYAISDMAYYRGRLVLASRDQIMMSRVDELFNFWIDRPSALADSDSISMQIASTDVAEIEHIVEFHGSLLIMTRQGRQYFLENVTTLSASTAAITPSTKYETLTNVRPITVGSQLFMVGRAEGFAPIWQYFFDDRSDSSKAVDVSKQVRGLLPLTIGNIAGSTGSQTLAAISDSPATDIPSNSYDAIADGNWNAYGTWKHRGGSNLTSSETTPQPQDSVSTLGFSVTQTDSYEVEEGLVAESTSYLYTFRWWDEGMERVQAAWAKWDYGPENLLDCVSVDDKLYILRRDDAGKTGCEILIDVVGLGDEQLAKTGFTYAVRLDQQMRGGGGTDCPATYDGTGHSGVKYTKWQLHLNGTADADRLHGHNINAAVLGGGYAAAYEGELLILEDARAGSDTGKEWVYAYADVQPASVAALDGNYTSREVMLGRRFDTEVELTRVFMRGDDNNPITEGRLRLNKLLVDTVNSGDYQVVVKTDNTAQPDRTYDITHTGFPEYSTSSVHVTANAEGTRVFLKSIDAQPCAWASIEWHGLYSTNIR